MINFMKYNWIYFGISGVLLLASILSIILWGLKPSIDFTGGALLEVGFESPVTSEVIISHMSEIEGVDISSVQSTESETFIVRTNTIDEAKKNEALARLSNQLSAVEEIRFETVGPVLGKELMVKTLTATILASILIMIYVTYQFKNKVFGLSAILAMLHDSILLLGAFSVFGKFYDVEIDVLFVTALLTTLSFSVHDTIVVFDRIRETLGYSNNMRTRDIINRSIFETLPRSLNNSMTIIFMLTALALLGGITIKWFVVALLIGTISGTYSSTFTAAPLLFVFLSRKK